MPHAGKSRIRNRLHDNTSTVASRDETILGVLWAARPCNKMGQFKLLYDWLRVLIGVCSFRFTKDTSAREVIGKDEDTHRN